MYLQAGSAGELGRRHGLEQVGFWRKILDHPAYDSFWQQQAMDKILAAQPLKVPTMLVDSLWDQEDIYGPTAVYKALKPKDTGNDKVLDGRRAVNVFLRSEEHTSELQSLAYLVCRLLLEKK